MLGHPEGLAEAGWPPFDPEVAKADEVVVPVQINGKVRARLTVRAGVSDDELRDGSDDNFGERRRDPQALPPGREGAEAAGQEPRAARPERAGPRAGAAPGAHAQGRGARRETARNRQFGAFQKFKWFIARSWFRRWMLMMLQTEPSAN